MRAHSHLFVVGVEDGPIDELEQIVLDFRELRFIHEGKNAIPVL